MNPIWRWTKISVLSALCVMAALYLGPLSMGFSFALSAHDVAPFWMTLFNPIGSWLLVLPGLAITVLAPLFVVTALIRARTQRKNLTPLAGYVALVWLVNWISFGVFFGGSHARRFWPQRRAGLAQAAQRAQPLLLAIENYEKERGQPPANLEALVPTYLPAMPATGMAAYPKFRYLNAANYAGNTGFKRYEVRVETPFGLSYDRFYFWPEGNYPAHSPSGRVERIGTWAYLHE